ncbi:hypothetical protein [Candidatus Nanosynbacter sp. TM7-008]
MQSVPGTQKTIARCLTRH